MPPSKAEVSHLRVVRDPEPVALYIRPFGRDLRRTTQLLAEGRSIGSGLVLDACELERARDLVQLSRDERLEVILDTRSAELSLPGGRLAGVLRLPWADNHMEAPGRFTDSRVREYVELVAQTAIDMGATAVLAPTHFLQAFPSPWFSIDAQLTLALRTALDGAGGKDICLYYPLITSLRTLRTESVRRVVFEGLGQLLQAGALDALWLRMHGFGTSASGPLNLRRYIELARDTHRLGVPVIGERTGTVGLALVAFGAVAGIESGITFGDCCDLQRLTKTSVGSGFLPPPRVYLPELGVFVKPKDAEAILSNRSVRNWLACQGTCCPRGIADMLLDPRRHFLVTRHSEVSRIARVPAEMRADEYLEGWLRPASDRATKAARVAPGLSSHRERLDLWRTTLADVRERDRTVRPSTSPQIDLQARPARGA